MNKSAFLIIFSLSLLGFGLQACSEEEKAPAALPEIPAAEAATPAAQTAQPAEPELKPIAPADQAPASIAPPASGNGPGTNGNYVIQVGIQPSEKGANRLAGKLSESGITSYLARVENPGELEGTYYRVRIGYFVNKEAAAQYAKSALEPLGIAWWIDNRSNDDVGNPGGSTSYSSQQSNTTTYSNAATYSAPATYEAPAAQTYEAPAAQTYEPAPTPASSAAAQPAQPAQVDDGWN